MYVEDIWPGSISVRDIWISIDVSSGRQCYQSKYWVGHDLWICREPVRRCRDIAVARYVWYPLSLRKGMLSHVDRSSDKIEVPHGNRYQEGILCH